MPTPQPPTRCVRRPLTSFTLSGHEPENLPSLSEVAWRTEPIDSFFTDTAAFAIGFPATSRTAPAIVAAPSPVCACSRAAPAAQRNTQKPKASTPRQRFDLSYMTHPQRKKDQSNRMVTAGMLLIHDDAVKMP